MPATPIFDSEILKLRRRLGDLYNEDGAEIIISTVGSVSSIGSTWKRDELVDIYNDAVRMFLDWITVNKKKQDWYSYVPGYIFLKLALAVISGKLTFNQDPKIYKVMDVRGTNGIPTDLAHELPPDEFFSTQNGFVASRVPSTTNIFYTILSEGTFATASVSLFILPVDVPTIDLVYLCHHNSITHGGASDLVGISNSAIHHIQVFAEMLARRYRAQSVQGLPEAEMQLLIGSNK